MSIAKADLQHGQPSNTDGDKISLQLELDMYSGPLDVLLELARQKKTDLTRLSMSRLAEQYIDFIKELERHHQDIASEYLVMACILVWMKSRMLLPEAEHEEEESLLNPEYMALRLRHIQALKNNLQKLMQHPQLGKDFFIRGYTNAIDNEPLRPRLDPTVTLHGLYRSYATLMAKKEAPSLEVQVDQKYTVEEALKHIRSMFDFLSQNKDWSNWNQLLPRSKRLSRTHRQSIIVCVFIASLELTRLGYLELMQPSTYEPLNVRLRNKTKNRPMPKEASTPPEKQLH